MLKTIFLRHIKLNKADAIVEIKKAKIIFSNVFVPNDLIKDLLMEIFINIESKYTNKNFKKIFHPPIASNVHFLLIKYAYKVPIRKDTPLEILILILKFKRIEYVNISSKTVLMPEIVNLLNSINDFFKIKKAFRFFD